jgi:hypothetical protein
MRQLAMTAAVLALAALASCSKKASDGGGGVSAWPLGHGRYFGVGIFQPGRMWLQLAHGPRTGKTAAATLQDDEEVIVVIDSHTGEVRECGNLSGYCISLQPWAATGAAAAVLKHAGQLDEAPAKPPAAPAKRTPH